MSEAKKQLDKIAQSAFGRKIIEGFLRDLCRQRVKVSGKFGMLDIHVGISVASSWDENKYLEKNKHSMNIVMEMPCKAGLTIYVPVTIDGDIGTPIWNIGPIHAELETDDYIINIYHILDSLMVNVKSKERPIINVLD